MDFEEQSTLYVTHDGKHVVLSVYDSDDQDEETRFSIAIVPDLAYQLARWVTKAAMDVEDGEQNA